MLYPVQGTPMPKIATPVSNSIEEKKERQTEVSGGAVCYARLLFFSLVAVNNRRLPRTLSNRLVLVHAKGFSYQGRKERGLGGGGGMGDGRTERVIVALSIYKRNPTNDELLPVVNIRLKYAVRHCKNSCILQMHYLI